MSVLLPSVAFRLSAAVAESLPFLSVRSPLTVPYVLLNALTSSALTRPTASLALTFSVREKNASRGVSACSVRSSARVGSWRTLVSAPGWPRSATRSRSASTSRSISGSP